MAGALGTLPHLTPDRVSNPVRGKMPNERFQVVPTLTGSAENNAIENLAACEAPDGVGEKQEGK